ncbi:MAG: SAM-dependent methyltransferase [Campylobacteraceae bacterium]|jgi:SAM-dependent MidA family methyltransferase|nr:SAM-dependent methyltransferase [Campylobacteraceae bacterium]
MTTPFSQYMNEWLYAKDGYYSSMPSIGKKGDFATSVTTSMFFGGTIAKRLIALIKSGFLSQNAAVVEIGAHHGYLIADMVQFIYTLEPRLLETLVFVIIEPQEKIQKEQERYLGESFGEAVKFNWYKSLKEFKTKEAFVVANELFDAFACEVVKDGSMLYMSDDKPIFGEIDEETKELCARYEITKGEVAKGYEEFAQELSSSVSKGEFITFDYGQKEPRGDISLRIYSAHKTYPFFSLTEYAPSEQTKDLSLKLLYKKSDLTYDVNFSHLKDVFEASGFKECAFCTQAKALVEFGLIDLLEILKNSVSQDSYRMELGKAMQLIDPSFLGERFSMMRFQKV